MQTSSQLSGSSMPQTLSDIEALLENCRYHDQIKLRKRIRQFKVDADGSVHSKSLQKLYDDVLAASSSYETRLQQALHISYPETLPVSVQADAICKSIQSNQVVIVAGETGSGKTTQLPKICLSAGLGRKGLIGHTQPRRLAARTVSNRIAEEMNVPLGTVVGYQVRFTEQIDDTTLIKVMTDGILLAEIKHDKYLYKYDAIIIDEAHERSLNIDFLLGYLKQILPKRPELKLIITSATIDVERFSAFFNDAPVFSVSGRSYPVDIMYRPTYEEDEYSQTLADQITLTLNEIIDYERDNRKSMGDVLVFLPGEREIREISKHLLQQSSELNWRDTEILPLYARLSNKDQNRVFAPHPGRRIVLSTNVAETSITVPGIRYVIDPGTVRMSRYSYRSKIQRLPVEAVSQASANQRAGRCGRVSEGICFRLYSEEDFNNRPAFTDPEILRTNLASVILKMVDSGLGRVSDFDFIDMPDSRQWSDGYKLLQELLALDEQQKLTQLGRQMAAIPADPRLARMLISAAQFGCISEVLVIVSALSIQDPRERPQDKQQAADQAHSKYKDTDSDFVSFLHIWHDLEQQRQALSSNQLKRYCQKNYLSFIRLREWREVHRQLYLVLKELKLIQAQCETDSFWQKDSNQAESGQPFRVKSYDSIHQSILSGLLGNIGRHEDKREYLGCRNRQFMMFPGSGLNKTRPKWIVAAELVETQQVYARYNAKIDPLWVEHLARHLIKRSWSEPRFEAKRAQIVAKEKISLYGLELISNRPVNYGQIDPVISRELFIRTGLVEGEFNTRNSAIKHNRELINKLENIEERTRRRDVVVDDEILFGLYENVIPLHIVSGASFEKWYKQLSETEQKRLYFSESQLTREHTSDFNPSLFPDHLENNGIRLPLSYQFRPGDRKDGVTLSIPVNALKQLNVEKLEKLVPGLLREKCMQLIKSLPRTLRKHFVPVPDVVDKILPRVEQSDAPLLDALSHELKRLTLVTVPAEAWNTEALDDYLKFNIQVLSDTGKVIEQGRDLTHLAGKLEHLMSAAVAPAKTVTANTEMQDWAVSTLPDKVLVKQAGIELYQFPCLKDKLRSVEAANCNDQILAEQLHRMGVARLLFFRLESVISLFRKQDKRYARMALLFAPVGKAETLYDDFVMAAIADHFFAGIDLPRNKDAFEACWQSGRGDFYQSLENFADLVVDILNHYHELMKHLKGKLNLSMAMPMADLQHQLTHLVYPGFLSATPLMYLKSFPRYLNACAIRFEKMPRDMANERRYVPILTDWWKNYEARLKKFEAQGIVAPELTHFRWLLEEQRVSWYAQHLGTNETVSEKRLNKLWESIRR
jgi:ATP-dependent helicase HrpA